MPVRTEPSSVAEVCGRAALWRGRLWHRQGSTEEARQAFAEATQCSVPDVSATAAILLSFVQ